VTFASQSVDSFSHQALMASIKQQRDLVEPVRSTRSTRRSLAFASEFSFANFMHHVDHYTSVSDVVIGTVIAFFRACISVFGLSVYPGKSCAFH